MLLADELRDAWRTEAREHRVALTAVVAIAVALRLLYLAQPMRNDEAVTYLDFVRLSWTDAASTYTTPDNHLFHTLLAKLSVAAFGASPWAVRLPAFLAGVLVVPATYAVARTFHGSRAALVASAFVATSGMLVLYSTNARGYALVVLAFLVLVLLATRLLTRGTLRDRVAFAVVGALGLWTSPVMLYPLGTVIIWFTFSALVEKRAAALKPLLVSVAAMAALTGLAYAPVIAREGLGAVTRNDVVAPSDWFAFFQMLPTSLMEAVLTWSLGVPLLSIALLGLALLAIRRPLPPGPFRVALALAAFVWCSWLLLITHRAPAPRVWLWVFPVVAMAASAELVRALERRERTRALIERRPGLLAGFVAIAVAIRVVTTFAVPLSGETGTFRDAREAAATLAPALGPEDLVLAAIPTSGPLSYYLELQGVTRRQVPAEEARRVFIVLDAAEGQTLDRLTEGSSVRDTTRFAPAVPIATFTTSGIFMYERRDGTTR